MNFFVFLIFKREGGLGMGYIGRDVAVSFLKEGQCLVAACDSSGAIGSKALDVVKVPEQITGRFATRVALFEIIASGAEPKMLTIAISNENNPTGEGILEGVREELRALNLEQLPLVISTEKNMITQQTGLGISAIGVCEADALRLGATQIGDFIYGLGVPKVGPEVFDAEDPEIIQGEHILKLLGSQGVHDIVPVGSQGIRGEAELLAHSAQGIARFDLTRRIDMYKSAGPSTALIFTIGEKIKEEIFEVFLGLRPYFVGRVLDLNKRRDG